MCGVLARVHVYIRIYYYAIGTNYCIAGKFCRRNFRDFAEKQAICGLNFAICVDSSRLRLEISPYWRLHFRDLGEIAKTLNLNLAKFSRYMVSNYTSIYCLYWHVRLCMYINIVTIV